jgi:RNA recognition motif-containing protein
MHVKLFVGNLPWRMTSDDLGNTFADHGEVLSARVVIDRETQRSRGFGFVEMDVDNVDDVIEATNGLEVFGRPLRVNVSDEKPGFGNGPRRAPREESNY